MYISVSLAQVEPMLQFYMKRSEKSQEFLIFSGGLEMEHRFKMVN